MKTDWVNCPICHQPDMEAVHYGDEDGWYVNCVNLSCPSNQVGTRYADLERPPKPPKVIKGHSMHGWDDEPMICTTINVFRSDVKAPIGYLKPDHNNENWSIRDNLFTRFYKKVLTWFKRSV